MKREAKQTIQADSLNLSYYWPRGKGLGGSGAINGMFYVRGSQANYDAWASEPENVWMSLRSRLTGSVESRGRADLELGRDAKVHEQGESLSYLALRSTY
jgi:choline dehydrogenase-like flavoprotein